MIIRRPVQDRVGSSVADVIEPALQAVETAPSAGRPTADLGADTDQVLRELGYPTENMRNCGRVGIV